jgi:mono/diheme cytochrome c family protein
MKSRVNRVATIGALLTGALAITISACGGKEQAGSANTTATGTSPPSTPPPPASAGEAPGARGGASPAATAPPGTTSQMIALGDSVFHGQAAGGLCFTCHGADAKGTSLAPPLVAHNWLTGDGSYQFIQQRVTEGVPSPTPPYTVPMPPKGGANLSDDQVKAVSAYVYSISRGGK